MSEQENGAEKSALMVVGLLVIAVVIGVVGFGAHRALGPRGAVGTTAEAPAGTASAAPSAQLFFAIGEDTLPADAGEALERISAFARANDAAMVRVSGFHDASGDRARNEDLARRRAEQVRHALEANGVARGRVVMTRPEQTDGGADPKLARRVDVAIQ